MTDDLDTLLQRASENLLKRRQDAQQAQDVLQQQKSEALVSLSEQDSTSTTSRKSKSAINRVRLSTGIPSNTSYLKPTASGKSKNKPVTLNKDRIKIVDAPVGSLVKAGLDQKVSKGLDKHHEDLVEKIVIPKRAEVMPPTLDMSAKEKKRLAKEAETTGPGWFNMKAPDLTDEIKRDLEVIRSRAALDPKRHYKKPDKNRKGKSLPKFFQIGTVMDSATDFYSGRLSNKERKNGILEELMADRDTKASLKKRFTKIQVAKEATAKPYRRPVATMRGKSKKVALSTSAKKKMRM